jgi:hypothetical protein
MNVDLLAKAAAFGHDSSSDAFETALEEIAPV